MPKLPTPSLTPAEVLLFAAWFEAGAPEKSLNSQAGIFGGSVLNPLPEVPLVATYESIRANILAVKCIACHSGTEKGARVPLNTLEDLIDSPREIVAPGSPEDSGLLIVTMESAHKRMPPRDSGITALKDHELAIIEEWISNGAKD